jgi:hypothetical protein
MDEPSGRGSSRAGWRRRLSKVFQIPQLEWENDATDPDRSFGPLGSPGMIVEDIADNLTLLPGLDRFGIAKRHQRDQRLPSCPAPRTPPGRRIERNS